MTDSKQIIEKITKMKKVYGNNLEEIAEKWSEYLGKKITGKDVAKMMVDIKNTRIMIINNSDEASYMNKTAALEENIFDRDVYQWIYENWKQFQEIIKN